MPTTPPHPAGTRHPRPRLAVAETIDLLRKVLLPTDLTGAACTGTAPLFDRDPLPGETAHQRDARHRRAAALCTTCPVLDECRNQATALKRHGRRGMLWPTPAPTHRHEAA